MDEEKKGLIREFSTHFETSNNFAPLTSKIYAYLVLDTNREGVTFDELVEVFNVSKSSVSNSLNFLYKIKQIEYYTRIGDRKRIYQVSQGNFLYRLENVKEMLKQEKRLSVLYKSYCLKKNMDPEGSTIKCMDVMIPHFDNVIEGIDETINKLKKITANN